MFSDALFTVFIPAYYRPELLRQSIQSVLTQTHQNLELILVDNGALPEVKECLAETEKSDARVSIIRFEENQFSIDDPLMQVDICWNAALRAATGEYIFHLSHDDMLAPDYLEKMIALFEDNPSCTSAAGLPVGVNIDGSRQASSFAELNARPRYMEGHVMALDHLRGGCMYGAPGYMFTFRRKALILAGGYHRNLEDSHLYGVVPFGETGYDPSANFFWRYHENQLNKQLTKTGVVFMGLTDSFLEDWQLEEKWQVFGEKASREVVSTLRKNEMRSAATVFVRNLSEFRFRACARTVSKAWHYFGFWRFIPGHAWFLRRHFVSNFLKIAGIRDTVRGLTQRVHATKR